MPDDHVLGIGPVLDRGDQARDLVLERTKLALRRDQFAIPGAGDGREPLGDLFADIRRFGPRGREVIDLGWIRRVRVRTSSSVGGGSA